MNIGSVHPTASGELVGQIAIMSFDARIGLRPVASANERAPKFDVVALNCARRWVRIGALWEKEASQSGEIYLTGHLDDPCLPAKLFVAAFRQEDGGYAVAWTRSAPAPRAESRPGAAFDADDTPAPALDEPASDEAPRRRRRAPEASTADVDDPFA